MSTLYGTTNGVEIYGYGQHCRSELTVNDVIIISLQTCLAAPSSPLAEERFAEDVFDGRMLTWAVSKNTFNTALEQPSFNDLGRSTTERYIGELPETKRKYFLLVQIRRDGNPNSDFIVCETHKHHLDVNLNPVNCNKSHITDVPSTARGSFFFRVF